MTNRVRGLFKAPNPDAMGPASSTIRRLIVTAASLAAQGALRLGITLAMARAMGAERYGPVATILAICMFASVLWPASISPACLKFIPRARESSDLSVSLLSRHISLRAIQSALVTSAIAALLVAIIVGRPSASIIGAVVLTVVGLTAQSSGRGFNLASGYYAREGITQTLAAAASLCLTLSLLSPNSPAEVALVLISIPLLAYGMTSLPWQRPRRSGHEIATELDRFVTVVAIGSIASAGFVQASIAAAAWFHGASGGGQYAVAVAMTAPISLASAASALVLYPRFSTNFARGDWQATSQLGRQATLGLAALIIPTIGAIALLAPGITVLLGSSYETTAQLIPMLVVAVVLTATATPSVAIVTTGTHNSTRLMSTAAWAGAIIGVCIWLWDPLNSVSSIAVGQLVGAAVTAGSGVVLSSRSVGTGQLLTWVFVAFLAFCPILIDEFLKTDSMTTRGWIAMAYSVFTTVAIGTVFVHTTARNRSIWKIRRHRPERHGRRSSS